MTTKELHEQLAAKSKLRDRLLKTLTPASFQTMEQIGARFKRWKEHPQIKGVRMNNETLHLDLINAVGNEYALEAETGYRIRYAETLELLLNDIEYHLSREIPTFKPQVEIYARYNSEDAEYLAMENAREADNLEAEIDAVILALEQRSTAATFSIGSYPESGDGINPYYHR